MAAESDSKKSPHMQQRQIQQQQQLSKVQQQLSQQSPKIQAPISKPSQSSPSQPKPVQVPLKQAGQSVPVKSEPVQPQTQQKLPTVPARRPSVPSSPLPASSEPPKMKAPQLSEATKRTQSVVVRGNAPPPIPARSGSVQYHQPPSQTRPIRRQQTLNSAMPPVIPQQAPEFYIPQRRGSITRQQSSSATPSSSSSKISK